MTATVVPARSNCAPTVETVPSVTRSSICALVPKVDRTDSSNAESAVSTATPVLFAALVDRIIPIDTNSSGPAPSGAI
jgi:hypothetical protein